jgi:hypothetical protein
MQAVRLALTGGTLADAVIPGRTLSWRAVATLDIRLFLRSARSADSTSAR